MKRTIFEHAWRGSSQSFARTNSWINKSHDLNKPIRAKYKPPNHQLTSTNHHFGLVRQVRLFYEKPNSSFFKWLPIYTQTEGSVEIPKPNQVRVPGCQVSCVSTFPFPTCAMPDMPWPAMAMVPWSTRNPGNQMVIHERMTRYDGVIVI